MIGIVTYPAARILGGTDARRCGCEVGLTSFHGPFANEGFASPRKFLTKLLFFSDSAIHGAGFAPLRPDNSTDWIGGPSADANSTVTEANSTVTEANGTVSQAIGTDTEANGTVREANGTDIEASDTLTEASGTIPEANGTVTQANGTDI